MFFLFVLLLLSPTLAWGYGTFVLVVESEFGPYELDIIWSDSDSIENPTLHVGTTQPVLVSSLVEVQGVFTMVRPTTLVNSPLVQPTPLAAGAVALQVDSNLIITGPRGCDSPDGDPQNGFIVDNCVTTQAEAFSNMQDLLKDFAYPLYGENRFLCTSGSFYACLANFGGVLFIYPNQDSFVVRQSPPPAQVFFAQRIVLVGTVGLFGTERTVVDVPIQGPLLVIDSQSGCGVEWEDTYYRFPYDVYTGMGTEVVQSARGSVNTIARVLVKRNPQNADSFWVELASAAGTGTGEHYFVPAWISNTTFNLSAANAFSPQDGSQPIWQAFEDFVIGQTIGFFLVDSDGNIDYTAPQCTAHFVWDYDPDAPPTLVPWAQPNPTNWFLQPQPMQWQAAVFSYRFGALDEFGFLAYPWCPFGEVCGGDATGQFFTPPGFVGPPPRLNRTADSNFNDYTLSCDDVIGPHPYFQVYDAITGQNDGEWWPQFDPVLGLCFAPFMQPQLVQASVSPNAGAQDCSRQQMRCYDPNECLFCYRPIALTFCKLGWIPYDQWCYRRFNPSTDAQFLGAPAQVSLSCATLADHDGLPTGSTQSYAYSNNPFDLVFLQSFSNNSLPGSPSYAVVYPSGEYVCTQSGSLQLLPCVQTSTVFPMCRYKQDQYEVKLRWTNMSPQTVRLFRDGEGNGSAPRGVFTQPICNLRSTGETCETATCPDANLLTVFSPGGSSNDSSINFFATCSAHGGCDQWNPNRCACDEFFSPVAYVPGVPQLYPELASCPCCCPATSQIGGQVSINGNIYTLESSYLACGGAGVGNCITNNATGGSGECECFPVANTDPAAEVPFSDATGGPSCACVINKILSGGFDPNWPPINADVCSNRGTCCPIGVSGADAREGGNVIAGGTSSEVCYPNGAIQPTTGCVCDNGFTAQGCGAPAPVNLAFNLQVFVPFSNLAYVSLGEATIIGAVIVGTQPNNIFVGYGSPPACTAQQVWLASSVPLALDEIAGVPCNLTQIETQILWECPTTFQGAFFVVVVTEEITPRCTINAMNEYFVACGPADRVNPFVSGFWRAPAYRQPYKYSQQASTKFAPYGSSLMACGCGSNAAGPQCGEDVSALRLSPDGTTFQQVVCGSDTFYPRGYAQVSGDGTFSECVGAPFAGTQAVGAFIGVLNGATDEQFGGPGNAWQLIFNQERGMLMWCNGHGIPIPPQFPYGDCEFNVVAYEADALYTPFVEAPGSIVNANTHEFLQRPTLSPTDDPRSLVSFTAVAGLTPGSWLIPTGTYVVLPEIVGSIGLTCAQTTRVPLTANFGTNVSPYATSPALPVRAFATVTIWTLNPNDLSTSPSVQQCDPALYQSTQYASACSTQNWCPAYFLQIGYIDPTYSPSTSYALSPLESSCIASAIWSEIPGTSTNFQAMGDMLIELECSNTKALQQNTATVLANAIQFPSLDCANAVDRMVDVGWWVRYAVSLGYQLQCGSQPIGPYDYVIGTAFGLMYNQIPDLQFPLDYRYWTAAHYNITASVLNYLRTYDATGTPLDDQILTEALLDEYLLSLAPTLPNATSVAAIPIAPLIVDGPSYIVPGQTPTTVVRLSEAGPPYDTWLAFHSMRVPWIAWDVVILRPQIYYNFAGDPSPETASAFQNAVWSAWALQTGKGSPQDGYTQAEFGGRVVAMLQAFPTMALPGVWQSAPGFLANSGTLVTVTHVANLSAFEMWRSDGTRCGVAYNVVAGQNTTMVCSGSFNTSAVAQLAQYMQALYNSIGGPAGSALNGSANAALNSTGFVFSETATDDWEGVHFRSVPYDSMFTIAGNGSSVDWNNAYSAFVTQFMQMAASVERTAPYTIPAANMFYQIFEEPPQDALDALTESIVVNHQWPYNKLVANAQAQAVAAGGFTLPFNISDYSDQIALKNSYYTLWPPSKCTADKQCQSFSRNGYTKCVYDESTIPYRPYRNGDPSWSAVLSLGDEGGCQGASSFGQGFWNSQQFNLQPLAGYGPSSAAYWLQAVNWQNTMYEIFPFYTAPILFNASAEPFATLLALEGDDLLDALNSTMGATLPWDYDTNAGICGGGGTVEVALNTTQFELVGFPQQNPALVWTPTCTSLTIQGFVLPFELEFARTPNDFVYFGGNDTLTVVEGTPYLTSPAQNITGAAGALTGSSCPTSTDCAVDFGSGPLSLNCANPALFSADAHVDVAGFYTQGLSNGFLTELVSFA